jgi:3-dehydroquinate synthase
MANQKYKMHQHDTIFSGPKSNLSIKSFILAAKDTYSGIFILVDTNTRMVCLPVLQRLADLPDDVKILEVEPGEKSKSFETTIKLWNELAALGADRYSLLICLGGGVICDLGGFVASTYQRGIEFVYIPTSLLAQVDAAIGGKTGINLNQLKNYVGLFSTPKAIFILTEFLQSLPFAELLAGYAEVVKHALLSSEKTFRQLTKQFPDQQSIRNCKEWDPIVSHSVKVKSNVVNSDPTEKGLRKILNFGHTVGHAFESHSLNSGNTTLPHGYAVAMGLIVELCLSVKLSGFPEKLSN